MARSVYDILESSSDRIVIRDVAGDGPFRSVTNDAEQVVKELVKSFGNRRIFYYDSVGDYGELLHDEGVFKGFAAARD